MDTEIQCACGHRFSADVPLGATAECPACGREIRLPDPSLLTGGKGVHREFRIRCGCGEDLQLDEPPGEDFRCPRCGAPMGGAIAEMRRRGPDKVERVVITRRRKNMSMIDDRTAHSQIRWRFWLLMALAAVAAAALVAVMRVLGNE